MIIRPVLQLSVLGELCFIIEVTLCHKLTFHFNGNWARTPINYAQTVYDHCLYRFVRIFKFNRGNFF